MIFLLFVEFAAGSNSRMGPFFAAPTYVVNFNNTPEISNYFFYLQQLNKSTTVFRGDIEFKRKVGPMEVKIDSFVWTGRKFARPSGSTGEMYLSNGCAALGTLLFFESFEPQSGFLSEECSFLAGNYTMEFDWNALLHRVGDIGTYGPERLFYTILERDILLFKVTIEVTSYNLNLYKFIPKD